MAAGDVLARLAAVASGTSYLPSSAGGGPGAQENVKEAVENALEGEDIGQLVRLSSP